MQIVSGHQACIQRDLAIDAQRRHAHGCLIGREQQVLHQELAFRCCRWMEPSDNQTMS